MAGFSTGPSRIRTHSPCMLAARYHKEVIPEIQILCILPHTGGSGCVGQCGFPSFPKMLLMTYLGWLLGIGCQPKCCSFIFQPVAVLCNRSRTIWRATGVRRVQRINKSVKAVHEDYRLMVSIDRSREQADAEHSGSHGVSIRQSAQIPPASLSGCIVQSNFRCASCVLQHLLLHHVKCAASFHGKISRQCLWRFRVTSDYFYRTELITHHYRRNV